MRALMMISNNNVAVRELYGLVLRERHPTWGVSHMSGLPPNPAPIVKAYDVLIYELGAANDPKRYKAILALWEELKGSGTPGTPGTPGTTRIVTHIEGPFREGVVAELEVQGVVCVGAPFTPEAVAAALDRVAPTPKGRKGPAEKAGEGERRGLFGGLFRRRE